MTTYLIIYDLNKKGQDYKKLIDCIETSFDCWWHHLDSNWIVKSKLSALEIKNLITPLIDQNDELLVVTLCGESAWQGFNEKGTQWLSKNLDNI
jgi:hypothetical protein